MATQNGIVRRRPVIGRAHASGMPVASMRNSHRSSVRPLGAVFVSSKAPFMSVVSRAIKILDRGPGGARWSSTKVAPLLQDRIDLATQVSGSNVDWKSIRQRSVLLLATGHAISKLVLIAAWFRRQTGANGQGYVVTVRTRWAATVDDIFDFEGVTKDDDDKNDGGASVGGSGLMEVDGAAPADGTESSEPTEMRQSTRVRTISCLEVAIRLK